MPLAQQLKRWAEQPGAEDNIQVAGARPPERPAHLDEDPFNGGKTILRTTAQGRIIEMDKQILPLLTPSNIKRVTENIYRWHCERVSRRYQQIPASADRPQFDGTIYTRYKLHHMRMRAYALVRAMLRCIDLESIKVIRSTGATTYHPIMLLTTAVEPLHRNALQAAMSYPALCAEVAGWDVQGFKDTLQEGRSLLEFFATTTGVSRSRLRRYHGVTVQRACYPLSGTQLSADRGHNTDTGERLATIEVGLARATDAKATPLARLDQVSGNNNKVPPKKATQAANALIKAINTQRTDADLDWPEMSWEQLQEMRQSITNISEERATAFWSARLDPLQRAGKIELLPVNSEKTYNVETVGDTAALPF